MEKNKIITYSLLAHINNSGLLVNDLLSVFEPLVKQVLSKMNIDGIMKGKNISEIKQRFDNAYKLEIPLPVLRNILRKIAADVNTNGQTHFEIYTSDDSFLIHNFIFLDYDDIIVEKEKEILELEEAFKQFCKINLLKENDFSSIFDFIECNKLSLVQYLNVPAKISSPNFDFNNEAKFIEFFRGFPDLFKKIRDIYLGSIISCYLEYKTTKGNSDLEVLFDTNYILALLDLNSEEAHMTCKTLLDILTAQGVKLKVMDLTISECQHLLDAKAEYFNKTFLLKKINSEDIYNACDRRGLTKTDLQLISSRLEETLSKLGISSIGNTSNYQKIAKVSDEYNNLKKKRNIEFAALHDATAIYYVRTKRGTKIKDFENVNCWFVNNSSNLKSYQSVHNHSFQPEAIKAEDLLNILWLSNPNILSNLKTNDLVDIGITRLISCTLNDSLPKASVLREFEVNIQKYATADLTDKDVLRVATRLANKSIISIDELNALAENNQKAFVDRLKLEAAREKEKEDNTNKRLKEFISKLAEKQMQLDSQVAKFDKKYNELKSQSDELNRKKIELADHQKEKNELSVKYEKEKAERIKLENEKRVTQKRTFVKNKIFLWRCGSFIWILLLPLIFLILYSTLKDSRYFPANPIENNLDTYLGKNPIKGILWLIMIVYQTIFIAIFTSKFFQTNKSKFVEQLDIPEYLREINE